MTDKEILLSVENLKVHFHGAENSVAKAVDGVSLSIKRGEVIGLKHASESSGLDAAQPYGVSDAAANAAGPCAPSLPRPTRSEPPCA